MRGAALAALFLATIATAHAQVCPDISGVYALVGEGDVTDDVRRALGVHSGAPVNSRVEIEGEAGEDLRVTVTPYKRQPYLTVVLKRGSSFTCQEGRLVFTGLKSRRETDKGMALGNSTVRLRRVQYGGLGIEISFTGSRSSTIYSYDSANVKIPIPFSSVILRNAIEWPAVAPYVEPPPEPKEILEARAMLDDKVLGTVTLNALRIKGDAVLASLAARSKEDVGHLEDRLRAASIPFEMKGPRWIGTGYYELELLVRPKGSGAAVATRPSVLRVEQELTRIRWGVDVSKVEAVGDTFVATLRVEGTRSVEDVISMFKKNTTLFADIRPLKDTAPEAGSRTRVVQIQLLAR